MFHHSFSQRPDKLFLARMIERVSRHIQCGRFISIGHLSSKCSLSCRVDPTVDGDYRLCFDNSFSKMSEKMVFFEVVINNQNSKNGGQDDWLDTVTSDSMVDYKMEDIRVRAENKIMHVLDLNLLYNWLSYQRHSFKST